MDILKQVEEILREQDPQEKEYLLEALNQVLEYHRGLNDAEIVEAVQLLLPAALQEDDKRAREAFFDAMNTAAIHHDIERHVDWDILASSLSSLAKGDLEYALDLLGFSGQIRYLPILNEYTHDADPEIREWAEDAIKEVEYRVAHASSARKVG